MEVPIMDSVYRKAQMVQMEEITKEIEAQIDSLSSDMAAHACA